jgi:beta-1,4-mannosyl-glycoprotein beta-1,4-N-acetylglucosaminyltransferase
MAIVDCFPFFAPYGEELLYLRVNLLKDYVDKFIIVESDKTHSGKPVERKFMEIARNQGLPIEKIIYVEHDIPDTEHLQVRDVDRANAGVNAMNEESLYARVRERLQKDAVMQAMHQFKNDDVFIYGDADEIINPKNVQWVSKIAQQNQNVIIKIPLVYLQGRADLRIYHQNGEPVVWWKAMFLATKGQIMQHTINNIRCGNIPHKVMWPTHGGKVIQDMGWHFAWMGDKDQRQVKADSFAHAHDSFKFLGEVGSYSKYKEFVDSNNLTEGNVAPDGNLDHILKRYPHQELPQLIFDESFVKDFLLPDTDIGQDYSFGDCKCYWCEKLQFPLMYDLDGEKMWFEVPRSCSVTVKESFPNKAQVMRRTRKYREIVDVEKPIVIFTDPLERFISLINVYLVDKQRYHGYGKDIFSMFGKNLEECTKEEKINLFFKNLHRINSNHQVHHFHPQCRFVDTENFEEFTIVLREDVNEFFGINQKLNETKKEITLEDFSDEQIEFITRTYKADYDFIEKYGDMIWQSSK